MARFKLTLEYDGTPFYGWQKQEDGPSVQSALERACEALDQAPVLVQGAGRTDSGVHALGQVAHIDLARTITANKVREALNHHLRPDPVAVLEAEEVDAEFNARFSAIKRHYLYRIIDRRPPLTLDKGQAWRVPVTLDSDAMHAAAQALVGTHDFSTFRDAQCQAKTPVKTFDQIRVSRLGEEVQITCSARSFLHRQVRSIVGSLVEVGLGKWTSRDFRAALDAADRARCGPVAPAAGLYLVAVDYPVAGDVKS